MIPAARHPNVMIRSVIARIRRRSWRRLISWRSARRTTLARRRRGCSAPARRRSPSPADNGTPDPRSAPSLVIVIPRHSRRPPRVDRQADRKTEQSRRSVGGPAVGSPRYPSPNRDEERAAVTDGSVIIIGGAEDKIRDRVILNRFVALAGGRDATIVVISTASSLGTEAGERYRQIFADLGVQTVRPLHATTRPQANDETAALALRDATGVFL